ncbi:imidazole glycerol phosphate synthase subunit HisH [Sideroxyarcus emersonii]|uniref:Imidazole glycerol phosphate synthase subunit HisH n=1 Tax=Sideroxyarcus emersonii TaxID=2764705 RepID=A0AAN1X8K4_9PROT|nr:imidazole glycerol phosphate synthase subunit HisH [Sideroxyarcus emersonii]BCK86758.1 imidazole glycerol phosphate synthase subunit HisH [Sideroxyarcus emersonii]
MVDIAIVDYGMGNLRSVQQAVRKVAPQANIAVTGEAGVIAAAGRVVFPGQGAAPDCMREIRSRGLDKVIADVVGEGKPFLGICMGLQVLFEHSEEGDTPCLGLFAGPVKRFASGLQDAQGNKLKVPHMGWNQVHHGKHALWDGIAQDARFYFVHSYYVQPRDAGLVQATSDYPQPFVCAVARDNLFAVQFHPEKSAAAGLRLLQNFINWNPV